MCVDGFGLLVKKKFKPPVFSDPSTAFYIMFTHMQKQRVKFIKSGVLERKEAQERKAAEEKLE